MEMNQDLQTTEALPTELPATKNRSCSSYWKDSKADPEPNTHTKSKFEKESSSGILSALPVKELEKLNTWKEGNKYGSIIEGTFIIPCKTFLNDSKWQPHLSEEEKFKIEDLVDYLKERNQKLGLIIDLNRSFDYYDFSKVKENNPDLSDTVHQKFLLENAAVPDEAVLDQIYGMLKKAHEDQLVVAMHCFHGVNRTGYVICDFMCRYLGLDADTAISRFESARTHNIEHEIMTTTLRKKYPRNEKI